jgi:hypothetical protein
MQKNKGRSDLSQIDKIFTAMPRPLKKFLAKKTSSEIVVT